MDLPEILRVARRTAGLSQAEVASAAGTSQSAIAAYEGGGKSPSLGTLHRVASAIGTGLRVELVFPAEQEWAERPFEALTHEECRSLWLHRAIAARIQVDPQRAMSVARENLAVMGRADEHGRAEPWRGAWQVLLDGPLERLLVALLSTSTYGSQLRQTAPFAGLLKPRERWAVYRSFEEGQG